MSKPLSALIVEDSDNDTLLLVEHLREGGYEPSYARVDTAQSMRERLDDARWDIVLCDFTMPRFSAFEALRLLHESGQDIPFLIVSGTIGEDRAVAAMKAGAHDYILKSNLKRLIPAVERELREAIIREERRRAEAQIRRLAFFDPLTGLPNRARFIERTHEALNTALRERQTLALLLMDINQFKEVNDTLGHNFGDALLVQVATRLRGALFDQDLVARLGGDEFGMLLPRIRAPRDIDVVVKKLNDALSAPLVIDGLPILVEASIGVALAPEHASDADGLLRRADVAMYLAKTSGSVHAVYDAEQDPHSPRRLALLGELRRAIEGGELRLYYQPKVNLESGRAIGVEALIRWQHPVKGLVMPADFIPIAERTGLIRSLTEWVIGEALRECANWRRGGHDLHVAVNLAARSLHDPQLPEKIADLVRESGLSASALMVEITESSIIVDPARALDIVTRLGRLGVAVAIDDFGTGYSSLAFIRKLPVDEIKIDRSFVLGMLENREDEVIARIVIDLGRNLRMKVVAEGVENEATRRALGALGCDHAQGYLFAPPIPPGEFSAWLERNNSTSGWKR
ncbi:MAG: hypothetical protein A2W18_09365 [Candidatus Muproteobacteria bacterium RBG_16_60_9]|uniref:Diguanylate cyclase n=1 Tax=Candidatus Muproteobacteria bacterium RBG_16_60_9 TaxID=1817755 RepID=A0A1F6V566_9PROT|nr:MAG: hypothetical protein A2W18_09365 [Candidatus Muproteobacteria bacterium RBG_16_60_9]